MKIPLIIASSLWHIGDLEKNTQGQRQSYEGNLLSASACPNAWASIARLGGKCYELDQDTMLINMCEALYDPQYEHLRLEVQRWGERVGYLKPGFIYVVKYIDSGAEEDEGLREIHFIDRDEALREAEAMDDEAEEVEDRHLWLATDALLKLHGLDANSASSGLEFALIEWAREHMKPSMVKGVYWDERLDELALSAPRAGMFSVKGFIEKDHLPDDEDCLEGIDVLTMERYAIRLSADQDEGLSP